MKLHLISDLHLEFHPNINNLSDLSLKVPSLFEGINNPNKGQTRDIILILAGDIGYPTEKNYWNFIEDCASKYKHVIYICGNHEYYDDQIDIVNDTIKFNNEKLRKIYPNLWFLNKEKVIIDDVTFLGTTLWTNIPENKEKIVERQINDYKKIYIGDDSPFNAKDCTRLHHEDLKWIKDSITDNTIIITHHLPSKHLSHKKYAFYTDINCAFWTDIDDNLFSKKILMWLCGHTHSNEICKGRYKNSNDYQSYGISGREQ